MLAVLPSPAKLSPARNPPNTSRVGAVHTRGGRVRRGAKSSRSMATAGLASSSVVSASTVSLQQLANTAAKRGSCCVSSIVDVLNPTANDEQEALDYEQSLQNDLHKAAALGQDVVLQMLNNNPDAAKLAMKKDAVRNLQRPRIARLARQRTVHARARARGSAALLCRALTRPPPGSTLSRRPGGCRYTRPLL